MPQEIMNQTAVGTLRVSAFSSADAVPAQGVRVELRSTQGELLAAEETDSEGQLSPVILPAPPERFSLSPEGADAGTESTGNIPGTIQTEEIPFAEYNLTAQTPQGDITTVQNLQIYADTTSLQTLVIPGQSSFINVLPPAIMGGFPEKIPESEQKPMPPAGSEVVLPSPVVPTFIVVHDGVPSDRNAKNYTVSYKEYIKNVASSEIFATWPREALKANIIAICSFTLNRIYTEWYRGKGYDFTITNSTAYDQSFIYGRTIFTEISDIVDEVFAMYIVRQGQSQPLFAQYCDGVRVNRSGWLSQWGSKELADNGLSALQILRSFYGRDISLREAERIEGTPSSFPGLLSIGSTGEGVRMLQKQLNSVSTRFPLIPKLAVDGIFGPATQNAVRLFQQIFNLPVTGQVNFGTWYRISDIYVAVEKLAE